MAFLLSSKSLFDLSYGKKPSILQWAKMQAHVDICASSLSIGMLFLTIDAEATLTQAQKLQLKRLVQITTGRMQTHGTLIDVDARAAMKWAEIAPLQLQTVDGQDMGDATKLILATALARNLTWIGPIEPAHQSLIVHGLRVLDPETGATCP